MKIGLIQVDGKWPNLALMKISSWHKQQGDQVERFDPMFSTDLDILYASKVFNDTPDYMYFPDDNYPELKKVFGGTGYNIQTYLPEWVESCTPDYSLYPKWNAAMGYTTRGCPNSCPFCIVPAKEGGMSVVTDDIRQFWTGQPEIVLLDNNLTAAPFDHFQCIINQIRDNDLILNISQGLDIRLLNEEHLKILRPNGRFSKGAVRLGKRRLHFAWDKLDEEKHIRSGIELLKKYYHPHDISFYVLVGYNTTEPEDLYRIEILSGLGVSIFVMPYNRHDQYQWTLANWCNKVALRKSVSWLKYRQEKFVG